MRTERALARHRAAIKERLIDATIAGIIRLRSNTYELEKMPPELRADVVALLNKLTSKGGSTVPGEGMVHGTVKEMSVGEAQMIVDEILALADRIESLPYDAREEF